MAVFVWSVGGGGARFGQSREEGVNTITQTNIMLCIKHVEHLVGVLYSGVVTGMHDFQKSGRKQDWEWRAYVHSKPTCRRYSVGRACVPFCQSCIVCWLFLRRLVYWQGVKRILTERPCRLTNRRRLGVHLLWDVGVKGISTESPAGSQTGVGLGYLYFLHLKFLG